MEFSFSLVQTAFKCTSCPIVQGSRLWYRPLPGGGKSRERLAVSKQNSHRFHMKNFNPKKQERSEKYDTSDLLLLCMTSYH
jgi:hypothetical protein